MTKSIKVLFEGWRLLQHSYGTVFAFILVHMWKLYGPNGLYKNRIIFYVKEMDYFRKEWESKRKLVYSKEYNDILLKMTEWNGEEVDLIYRHTYPYNINITHQNKDIPKCIFYTSEFAKLTHDYFQIEKPVDLAPNLFNDYIITFLKQYNNLYFVAPSKWSGEGMETYCSSDRNRVISHGVDNSIFYKINDNNFIRNRIRKSYNIKDDEILMINIGAMTTNKGILLILDVLNKLIKLGKKFKLILKGTGDLYQCSEFLNNYLVSMNLTREEAIKFKEHIIFIDKTLSYTKLNELFNACDLYISPYLAEGFGLTMLDALSTGLNVLVPTSGSATDYINYIHSHGGEDYIYKVDSNVIINENGFQQNNISINNLLDTILLNEQNFKLEKSNEKYDKMTMFIQRKYSWYKIGEEMYNYFIDILYKNS